MEQKDVVIIGGGPAGLAAAVELHKQGIRNMIILEREAMLGGILRQCIHDGFGLERFGESLSGPEYAQAFIDVVQCLDDYNIPLYLSHTVTEIHGRDRLTGVTISEVDANRRPILGTEKEYKCDTLILSVGLIPENKLLEDAAACA